MWRAAWRSFLAHKLRLASTGLAIVLGVGFVCGSLVLTDTINSTFHNLFQQADAGISVEVQAVDALAGASTNAGTQPMPASVLPRVQAVPGVADAVGDVSGVAVILDRHGKAINPPGPPTIGLNFTPDPALFGLTMRAGRGPTAADEVAIDAATASKYGFRLGDQVSIVTDQPGRPFRLVGILGLGTSGSLAGATLSAFTTTVAQSLFDSQGKFIAIDARATAGVSPTTLQDRIASALGSGFRVRTGAQTASASANSITKGLGFLTDLLLVFAAVALVVGSFLIANTFSMIVSQRTRELGLLRALGAERSQVMRAVLAEAGLTAVLASVVGIVAGLGMEAAVVSLLSHAGAAIPAQGRVVEVRTIVLSLVVGLVVTLASALGPARRATRVPPLAALRDDVMLPPARHRWRRVAGVVAMALGILLTLVGVAGASVAPVGYGGFLLLAGLLLLGATVAPALADVIGMVPAWLSGVTGRLARRNATRVPARTAANANALMIGVALVGLLSVVAASASASANALVDKLFNADFLISTNGFQGVPTGVAPTLARDPAVSAVGVVRQARAGLGSARFTVDGENPAATRMGSLDITSGAFPTGAGPDLLVSQSTAVSHHLKLGSSLPVIFPGGTTAVTVAGIFADNQLMGSWIMPLTQFVTEFPASTADSFVLVDLRAGAGAASVEAITRSYPSVKVSDKSQLEAQQRNSVNQLLSLFTALLVLALIIAFLGIANTLALSILERTREIGILRALGMSRAKVRAAVRWEAVILSAVGAIEGLVFGVVVGMAVISSLRTQGVHDLVVPWVRLVVYLVVACVLGTLAAAFPARRAARLRILSAIAQPE